MGSRKLVLMNLFAGTNADIENRLLDTVGKERVERMEKVAKTYIHYHVWNRWLVRSWCTAQGAQPGALWWSRGWDGGGGRVQEGVYNYSWFAFLYDRKPSQHCKATFLQLKNKKFKNEKKNLNKHLMKEDTQIKTKHLKNA